MRANRAGIVHKWSPGIWDGLLESLYDIERGSDVFIEDIDHRRRPR